MIPTHLDNLRGCKVHGTVPGGSDRVSCDGVEVGYHVSVMHRKGRTIMLADEGADYAQLVDIISDNF